MKMNMLPTFTTIKSCAITGFSILAITGATLVPLPAMAEPKDDGSAAKGCPVENEDGSTSYLPDETRIGLFYCKNGQWKFGTVILDLQTGLGTGTGHTGIFTLDGPLPLFSGER